MIIKDTSGIHVVLEQNLSGINYLIVYYVVYTDTEVRRNVNVRAHYNLARRMVVTTQWVLWYRKHLEYGGAVIVAFVAFNSNKMSEQLKEILDDFGLKIQDLNCKCERQIRDRIADEIVEDWNHVGRTLNVSNSGLAKIINDNVTLPRPQDKAVRMLDVWTEEDGGKATCLKLAEALLSRKRRDVVDILCEKISDQKKKAPEAGSSGTVSSHQQGNTFFKLLSTRVSVSDGRNSVEQSTNIASTRLLRVISIIICFQPCNYYIPQV